MSAWLAFTALCVVFCIWEGRKAIKLIPPLAKLYHWHEAINKTEWVSRGVGWCRGCRHAVIKRNTRLGPTQPKRCWFCLYYWCYLSQDMEGAPFQCKACNKGLLQRGEIPPYTEGG